MGKVEEFAEYEHINLHFTKLFIYLNKLMQYVVCKQPNLNDIGPPQAFGVVNYPFKKLSCICSPW